LFGSRAGSACLACLAWLVWLGLLGSARLAQLVWLVSFFHYYNFISKLLQNVKIQTIIINIKHRRTIHETEIKMVKIVKIIKINFDYSSKKLEG